MTTTERAPRLPSLTALAAFEALLRCGSIKAAADDLAVTSQAVSQQLRVLESQINASLIEYEQRQWRLTPAGEACAATLRSAFDGLRLAVTQVHEASQRPRLRVSVDPALASTWLVGRMARFDAEAAGFDVWLDASARLVDIVAGEADVAVRYGATSTAGLLAWRLFDDRVFPVCAPGLRDGPRPLRTPADLAGHVLLHLDWQPASGRWPDWSDWLEAADVPDIDANAGARFTDHALALQAAAAGQGVALASEPLVRDSLAAGLLVKPFALELDAGFGYDVLIRAGDRMAHPAMFAAWLRDEVIRA